MLTINCPVDGAGAKSILAPIHGYNLNLPITQISMKGAEFGLENHFCAVNKNPDEFRTRNLLTNNFYVKKITAGEKT